MAYAAVDKNGKEKIFEGKPVKYKNIYFPLELDPGEYEDCILIPKGSIKKLIGHNLTWEDEPVELRDESLSVCCQAKKVECRNGDIICEECGMKE